MKKEVQSRWLQNTPTLHNVFEHLFGHNVTLFLVISNFTLNFILVFFFLFFCSWLKFLN